MTKRDDDSPEPKPDAKKPPDAKKTAPPPPMAARIADVEPFVAPFSPPPGALKPPEKAPPVWRSNDGKKTGQLAAASAPLPKTVELEMPSAPAVPVTAQLEAPKPRSEESVQGRLFAETTYILNDAQLRGEQAAPLRDDEERTDKFQIPPEFLAMASEIDTMGDEPSPLQGEDTGPHSVLQFYDETTAILKDRGDGPEDDEKKK